MAIGQRIKFFRNLRKFTQKELGLKLNFPENAADVRVAQYESETRIPKEDVVKLKKLIINIYDDINKYTEYRNNNISDTSIGNMDFDDNNYYLNILSYKEIIKRKGHTNDTITYMYKTIIHELVHICHEENGTYNNSLIWVKEGIAIVLSKQYEGLDYKINNCSLEDLINNRRTWYINYYTLMDYALKKYGNDYIKRLVIDSNFSKEETSKIYNEVVKFDKVRKIL